MHLHRRRLLILACLAAGQGGPVVDVGQDACICTLGPAAGELLVTQATRPWALARLGVWCCGRAASLRAHGAPRLQVQLSCVEGALWLLQAACMGRHSCVRWSGTLPVCLVNVWGS